MAQEFDVVVIGAGPGGYVAAIKAAQAGKNTAIIEKEHLGGICLNWGCIPTKALLKSAEMFEAMQHADEFGIKVGKVEADFKAIIERSREVASGMSGGIGFLMKKNKITVIDGTAKFITNEDLIVTDKEGGQTFVKATDGIIIAAGHKPRTFPNLPIDGEQVFHYKQAMSLPNNRKACCALALALSVWNSVISTTRSAPKLPW